MRMRARVCLYVVTVTRSCLAVTDSLDAGVITELRRAG